MTSKNANAGAGDSGARQICSTTTKNITAGLNSQRPLFSQAPGRADPFGTRQAIQTCAFMARRRTAAAPIAAGAPPRACGARP